MAVRADQTVPGKYYRRTRGEAAGGYFMRPKTLTAQALVARLRKKKDPYTREVWLMQRYRMDSSLILMVRHRRGNDSYSGKKWEMKHYILVPPDMTLREVKTRPGYTGK